jgi:hypothetical protein
LPVEDHLRVRVASVKFRKFVSGLLPIGVTGWLSGA